MVTCSGQVVADNASRKWLPVANCRICGDTCRQRVDNRYQYYCINRRVTYFVCGDGRLVCKSLGIM